jgi:hypothetical protein
MDALSGLLQRKWLLVVVGLIMGIVVGLGYAWVIDPVDWINGLPEQLRDDLREDYLRMVIDSYSVNNNVDIAVSRYQNLGKYAEETLEKVGANPGNIEINALQNFRAAVEIFVPEIPNQETPAGSTTPSIGGDLLGSVLRVAPYFCGISAVIVVIAIVVIVLRRKSEVEEDVSPQPYEQEFDYEYEYEQEPAELDMRYAEPIVSHEPLATFRTIYTLGDDLYDDSFSIDAPTGDFLGECGVGIGDIIGVGVPKKVSAFEVWLFDKNDIQTVTKVLMSNYAYNDEDTRSRLAAKGDPILAESGGVIELGTASLRIEARIVDLTYGEGALPSGSFFERIAIELRAWYLG